MTGRVIAPETLSDRKTSVLSAETVILLQFHTPTGCWLHPLLPGLSSVLQGALPVELEHSGKITCQPKIEKKWEIVSISDLGRSHFLKPMIGCTDPFIDFFIEPIESSVKRFFFMPTSDANLLLACSQ